MPRHPSQPSELAGALSFATKAPEEVSLWIKDTDILRCPVRDVDPADFVHGQSDKITKHFRSLARGPARRLAQPQFFDQDEIRLRAAPEEIAVVHADHPGRERVDPDVVVPGECIARGGGNRCDGHDDSYGAARRP